MRTVVCQNRGGEEAAVTAVSAGADGVVSTAVEEGPGVDTSQELGTCRAHRNRGEKRPGGDGGE